LNFGRRLTLDQALAAMTANPQLLPIAGCTDLLVTPPSDVDEREALDLTAIPELRGVRWADDGVEIGAATTFAELQREPGLRRRLSILTDAAATIGAWQIQNRATLGGNVVNASPAGDSLPVLLALDAEMICASKRGSRAVPAESFFVSYRKTALAPDELLVAIRLPVPAVGTVQRFRKIGTRAAQAISKVVVAMSVRLDGARIASARMAAGSVAPTPVRLRAAEQALVGSRLDRATAELAARQAAAEVTPIDDVRSTADYRRHVLERTLRRFLLELAPHADDATSRTPPRPV